MTQLKRVRLAVSLAVTLLTAALSPLDAAALSFTVDSVGDSQTVTWSLNVGGGNTLAAQGVFTATSVSSSLIDLSVVVTNNTLAALGESVASVGFETNPSVTGVLLSPGAVFDALANDTNFPSFQTIEVCVYSGNNCSGGPFPGLLAAGATDNFTIQLSGNFGSSPSVNLDTFAIKFQGDLGSFEFEGNGAKQVPAPSVLILLGGGILGMWLAKRRG